MSTNCDDETFACANCKKTKPVEDRSDIDSVGRQVVFFSMNLVAPTGNKSDEICKRCEKQAYVWLGFLALVLLATPLLTAIRDGEIILF